MINNSHWETKGLMEQRANRSTGSCASIIKEGTGVFPRNEALQQVWEVRLAIHGKLETASIDCFRLRLHSKLKSSMYPVYSSSSCDCFGWSGARWNFIERSNSRQLYTDCLSCWLNATDLNEIAIVTRRAVHTNCCNSQQWQFQPAEFDEQFVYVDRWLTSQPIRVWPAKVIVYSPNDIRGIYRDRDLATSQASCFDHSGNWRIFARHLHYNKITNLNIFRGTSSFDELWV